MVRNVVGMSLKTGLLLGASIFTLPALGQGLAGVGEAIELDTIVITASRTEQSLMDVTRSVATVEQEEIAEKSVNNPTDLLRDIPGVTVLEGATPGLPRISIRGEGSIRNTILIDGQEVSDHSTYGSLFMINVADIERVEVVKGPSSVLHGSKAIGGVINIITKKGAGKPVEFSVGAGYDSSTQGYNVNSSVAGTKGNFDYRLSVTKSDHGDRETPNGPLAATTVSNGSAYSNQSIAANIGYTADNHAFRIVAEKIDMETDAYVNGSTLSQRRTAGLGKFILDLPQRDRTKVGVFYDGTDLTEEITKVHFDAYVQRIERQINIDYSLATPVGPPTVVPGFPPSVTFTMRDTDTQNKTTDDQLAIGANAQIDLELFDDHLTIFGAQFVNDSIDRNDRRTGARIMGTTSSPAVPYTETSRTAINDNFVKEASLTTFSAFLQDEWSVTDDLTLTAGGRYFHIEADLSKTNQPGYSPFSSSDDAFIGAFGLNYTGFDDLALRANVAQGYVYPTLLQNMLGSVFSPGEIIEANPDLKPERSINYEVGARFDNGVALLDVVAFYSVAEDYIDTVDCGTHGTTCASGASSKYINLDAATTMGVEISGSYIHQETGLTPYFDLTFMQREEENDGVKTTNVGLPDAAGRVGLRKNWDVMEDMSLMTDVYVRGASEYSKGSTEYAAFATLNMAASMVYEFGDDRTLRVNAAVENILDKAYDEPLSSLPAAGRAFKISSQLTF